MTDADAAVRPFRAMWLLYAVPILSAIALVLMLIQDVLVSLEAGEHSDEAGEGLHHLFIFDLAWPVFLAATLGALILGVGALSVSRGRPALRRFALVDLAYVAVAVAFLFVTGALEL